MFGHATWVGKLVAGTAVVSGLGALNGWTLVTAEMPFAAAKDGLFVPQFAKTFRDGTPWFGILVSTAVASALMAFAYSSQDRSDGVHLPGRPVRRHRRDPVLLLGLRAAGLSRSRRRRTVNGWALARDLSIAGTSVLFSLWVTFTSGYQAVYQAMLLLLVGIPIYAFLKARRERLGRGRRPDRLRSREQSAAAAEPISHHEHEGPVMTHAPGRPLRGRAAAAGHRPPPRTGAHPAHPEQLRRAAVRRRALGGQGARGARRLRRRPCATTGVTVHHFGELLAETLNRPRRGRSCSTGSARRELVGPTLADPLRALAEDVDPATLAELLIGGVTRSDLSPLQVAQPALADPRARRLRPRRRCRTRCSSGTTRPGSTAGVTINPMAKAGPAARIAAQPGGLPLPPAVRRRRLSRCYYGDDDLDHQPATLEGGDIHVLGPRRRPGRHGRAQHPDGVEILARELFRTGQAHTVIAVRAAASRTRCMHLDTVLTMIDVDTFVRYPVPRPGALRTWVITAADPEEVVEHDTGGLHVEHRDDLFATIAEALGRRQGPGPVGRRGRPRRRARAVGRRQQLPHRRPGRRRRLRAQHRHQHDAARRTASRCWPSPAASSAAAAAASRCMTCPIQRDGDLSGMTAGITPRHPGSLLKDLDLDKKRVPRPGRPGRASSSATKADGTERPRLTGKNIALIFEKTSTRTRCAFEVAAHDQGAHVTYLGPEGSHIGREESIHDTARVLGRMFDGIEFRGFAPGRPSSSSPTHAGVPVWNGLTDDWHPTQMLADVLTMTEHHDGPLEDIALLLPRRRPQQRRPLAAGHRRAARAWTSGSPRRASCGRPTTSSTPAHGARRRQRRADADHRRRRRRPSRAPTSSTPTSG